MNLLIRITVAAQFFHLGQLQLPMQFPPMPFGMPHGQPMAMSGIMPAPIPLAMPMPLGMPQQKLPIVVMPYYKPKDKKTQKRRQKRRHRNKKRYESDCSSSDDSSSDTSSSSDYTFRTIRRSDGRTPRRQVLTPVVSYITKDGYVVYQKKIKKDRAKDWLQIGKKSEDLNPGAESEEYFTNREMKKMKSSKKRRHKH